MTPKPSSVLTPSSVKSPGSAKTTSSTVSKPSADKIAYPVSRLTRCCVAVEKLRLRSGVIWIPKSTSLGNQVSSEPESTSASRGALARVSSFVFRATTVMHRAVLNGDFSELQARRTAPVFASFGARSRLPGQGILGAALAEVQLCAEVCPPVFNRLAHGRVFAEGAEASLRQLLEAHSESAPTANEPPTTGMSAGKNTYTYDAHTYHTKVPPQAIAELLTHYLPAGGLVLDPFAGSGMAGVAARVLGYDCILNELSPAACFIANRFTASLDPMLFEAGVQTVLSSLSDIRKELYSTECRECGRLTEILYTVWSYRVVCNYCGCEFRLWDACRKYGRVVREHKILKEFPCPACSKMLKKSTLKRTFAEPVQIGYKCCGSKQQEVTQPLSCKDIQRIRFLEEQAPLLEGFYPKASLPDGVNLRQPAKHGLDSIDKFYTRRNLAAMSHVWKAIHRLESTELAGHLAFVFTSLYQRVTRLSEFRFWGGSGNTAHFNVPFIFDEANVFVSFERKARTIQDHLETTASIFHGNAVVVNNSATSLDYLPPDSLDLIFTDPPFGANINYSEMNFLWESWLGVFTDNTQEAVVNRVQRKGIPEYQALMSQSLKECFRVLRPGHWLLLVFMNSSAAVWLALRSAILDAGFKIVKMDILDKQHGTFKQFVSENTAGSDLVLHCVKPSDVDNLSPEHTPENAGRSILRFLEGRHSSLPTNVYLHVGREEETDFRKLYSDWLAGSLLRAAEVIDFSEFRRIAQAWLDETASEQDEKT